MENNRYEKMKNRLITNTLLCYQQPTYAEAFPFAM
jgi:hypothetical protein